MRARPVALLLVLAASAGACSTLYSPADTAAGSNVDGGDTTGGEAGPSTQDAGVIDAVGETGPSDAQADADAEPPVDAGCMGNAACERVVFVTKASYPAGFVSLAAADAMCQQAASNSTNARVRGRTFQAWISRAGLVGEEPSSRFVHGTQNYVLPDGTLVAAGWTEVIGLHAAPIDHDENGAQMVTLDVWTATQSTGTVATPDCQSWSSIQAADQARVGSSAAKGGGWTDSKTILCSSLAHLYCFEK